MAEGPNGKHSREEARAAIEKLDLGRQVEKSMEVYGWERERALEAERWYRNFLRLCHEHDGPVAAIGGDADELWHLHILDTRKYASDCQAIFGHFLNHTPLYGERSAEDKKLFEETVELYERTFGSLPERVRWVCIFG
jgi:hypothetical protein